MTEGSIDTQVRQLAHRYSAGAAGYAAHWVKMLAPMSAGLLELMPLAETSRILDLGCGPGTLTKRLRQLAERARIVGIDRAEGMLERAPRIPKTSWCLMDGRKLAFAADSFDAAVLAFVLFHLSDLHASLRQVGRVLKPGGIIGTATFQTAPDFEAKRIWTRSLAEVSPVSGPSVADLSAVDCVEQTDRPDKLKALLETAGFQAVQTTTRQFEHQWEPEEYLSVRTVFGSSGAAYRSLDKNAQVELKALIRRRFDRVSTEAFRFSPTVLYATAHWPR